MIIRRSSRLSFITAACGAALLTTGGCFALWGRPPAEDEPLRLRGAAVRTLALVPLEAAPGLEPAAARFATALRSGLASRLGEKRLADGAPIATWRGYLGVAQAAQAGTLTGADALLTGRVIAWSRQARPPRVWVSAGLRLLAAERGSIIYTHDATATVPHPPAGDLNAAFDLALHLATQEFIDGLLGTPRS